MDILWIVNIPLPEVSQIRGQKQTPYGGWLVNASKSLATKGVSLNIAYPSNLKDVTKDKGELITYFSFSKKESRQYEMLSDIISEINPSLVHIFGTEFKHSLFASNIANKNNIPVVLTIQGLVSFIEKHFYANLPFRVINGKSFRNLIFNDNIRQLKKTFIKRGKSEIAVIKNVENIIGRTSWDRATTYQLNPTAKYYKCNESLREGFYGKQWNIEDCDLNSIFFSQASYPFKGLHHMIEALAIIIKRFPNSKLYVGGDDIVGSTSLRNRIKRNYYGIYIKRLIDKYSLQNHVEFMGILDESKMIDRFLKSNIFVSASSIENSSNSVGEAMILGVPTIASYVGGSMDILDHNKEGFLYQSDAPYMLAHYICEIFSNKEKAKRFSINAIERAKQTHDLEENTKCLMDIYTVIIGDNQP